MALKCFDLGNPNPSIMGRLHCTTPPIPCFSSPPSNSSHRLHFSRRIRLQTVSATSFSYTPRGLSGSALLPVRNRRSFLHLAAPHEDSAPLDVEIIGMSEFEQGKQSNEAWEQILYAFKEKTIKLHRISQEAFENYSKTTMVLLKKAAKDLNIEAAKASYDISIIIQELGEKGRAYIALAAENSPEPVKDVVETFTSCVKIKHVSEIRDFYVGVPYGGILSLGGFLHFMITGSTAAIRFGVILGGVLLALSVSSLRSWRKGEPINRAVLKCETETIFSWANQHSYQRRSGCILHLQVD
ncbi:hypothetical protein V2J09_007070 [Rumex salicifolius]